MKNQLTSLLSAIEANDINLTTIELWVDMFGVIGTQQLALALENNHHVTSISVSLDQANGQFVKDEVVGAMATILMNSKSITSFNLNSALLTSAGAKILIKALAASKSLKEIYLVNANLGDEDIAHLMSELRFNTCIETVFLGYNYLGSKSAHAIAEVLKVNQSLRNLSLNANKINDDDAMEIVKSLADNHSLVELDLGHNNITDQIAAIFAASLHRNHTLATLSCGNTRLGDEFALQISELLTQKHSLISLKLDNTEISDKGAKYLSEGLNHNQSMITLSLGHLDFPNVNPFAQQAKEKIQRNEDLLIHHGEQILNGISLNKSIITLVNLQLTCCYIASNQLNTTLLQEKINDLLMTQTTQAILEVSPNAPHGVTDLISRYTGLTRSPPSSKVEMIAEQKAKQSQSGQSLA